jgi:hypothetical protein
MKSGLPVRDLTSTTMMVSKRPFTPAQVIGTWNQGLVLITFDHAAGTELKGAPHNGASCDRTRQPGGVARDTAPEVV